VFVPSFFTVMDDIGRVLWHIFGRFIGPTDEPNAAPHAALSAETGARRQGAHGPRASGPAIAAE
jgi:hypothetical protein